jgi:endoglucanase
MGAKNAFQWLLLLVMSCCASGHVYLFEPPSRNVISHQGGDENCPHCLQANGPNAVKARGQGTWPTIEDPSSHGLCGDPVQNSAEPIGIADMKYMNAGTPQRTYVAGRVVEFKTGVSTHHWGHYEIRICDKALDRNLKSAEDGQNCLNAWVLKRAPRSSSCGNSFEGDCQRNNPLHPERWYLPPPKFGQQVAGETWDDASAVPMDPGHEVHTMRFVIPSDLKCEHCTLQWYYATGNTCAYDADYFLFDPGFKFWNHYKAGWATCDNSCCGPKRSGQWAEEFWNCADVKVVSSDQTTSEPPLTSTPATSTSASTALPTLVTSTSQNPGPTATPAPGASPVARHGRLSTKGNRVIDEHGDVVQLRGMSLFWSQWSEGSKYYNREAVRWLKEDWSVSLVRIAMGVEMGGFLQNPDVETARVKTVVDAAIEFGIYVIIDWHDHHAEQHIPEAKSFFDDMARIYGKAANVIFETFNEPEHQSWAGVIKPYHEQLIPVIRQYSDNLIILGTKTWSQDVDEASLSPVLGFNLAYTLHFYANTHKDWIRQKASTALGNGIPLFATEWGTCSADGNGEVNLASTQVWLDFLKQNHISDANWAISDKMEKCAALQPASDAHGGWVADQLTSSGAFVRTSIRTFHLGAGSPSPMTTTTTAASSTDRVTSTSEPASTTSWQSTPEPEPEPEPEPASTPSPSSPITSTIAVTTTEPMPSSSTIPGSTVVSTTATTTSSPSGGCDTACLDIKTAKECIDADNQWQMCSSSSNSWWHGQCKASCSRCESGLSPCTPPPPTSCDPLCKNSMSVSKCQNADAVWRMCSGSDAWWKRQCQAFCKTCRGGLPPCTQSSALVHESAQEAKPKLFLESSEASAGHKVEKQSLSLAREVSTDLEVTAGSHYGRQASHWMFLVFMASLFL